MSSLVYKDKIIDYYLMPSKRRRSIVMRVDRDSRVQVRAPKFTTVQFIEEFIKERVNWIIKKQHNFKKFGNLYQAKEFKTGETFPLFDQELKLNIEKIEKRKSLCESDGKNLNLFIGAKVDINFKTVACRVDWAIGRTTWDTSSRVSILQSGLGYRKDCLGHKFSRFYLVEC